MKTLIHAAIVVLTVTGPLHAEPTPVPKAPKAKTAAQVRERSALPAGATGVLVAKLRADGSVQKVLISQSTGNKAVDAQAVRVLSAMRFPPDTLTKTERAKREKVFPVYQTNLEELKKFRNGL